MGEDPFDEREFREVFRARYPEPVVLSADQVADLAIDMMRLGQRKHGLRTLSVLPGADTGGREDATFVSLLDLGYRSDEVVVMSVVDAARVFAVYFASGVRAARPGPRRGFLRR